MTIKESFEIGVATEDTIVFLNKNMEEIEDIPNENLEVLSINNSSDSHVSEIVVNAL